MGKTEPRIRKARPLPEPRSWMLVDQDRFGKILDPQWVSAGDDFDRVAINAARLQHDIVRAVDMVRAEEGWSWRHIATLLQTLSEAQLTKVVRGQAPMSFAHATDLTQAMKVLLDGHSLLLGGVTLRVLIGENERLRREVG